MSGCTLCTMHGCGGTSFSKLFSKLWLHCVQYPLLSFDGLKSQRALVAVLGKAH